MCLSNSPIYLVTTWRSMALRLDFYTFLLLAYNLFTVLKVCLPCDNIQSNSAFFFYSGYLLRHSETYVSLNTV